MCVCNLWCSRNSVCQRHLICMYLKNVINGICFQIKICFYRIFHTDIHRLWLLSKATSAITRNWIVDNLLICLSIKQKIRNRCRDSVITSISGKKYISSKCNINLNDKKRNTLKKERNRLRERKRDIQTNNKFIIAYHVGNIEFLRLHWNNPIIFASRLCSNCLCEDHQFNRHSPF